MLPGKPIHGGVCPTMSKKNVLKNRFSYEIPSRQGLGAKAFSSVLEIKPNISSSSAP